MSDRQAITEARFVLGRKLAAVLTDLESSYWVKPPEELLAVTRTYRQRVDQHGWSRSPARPASAPRP